MRRSTGGTHWTSVMPKPTFELVFYIYVFYTNRGSSGKQVEGYNTTYPQWTLDQEYFHAYICTSLGIKTAPFGCFLAYITNLTFLVLLCSLFLRLLLWCSTFCIKDTLHKQNYFRPLSQEWLPIAKVIFLHFSSYLSPSKVNCLCCLPYKPSYH